MNEYPIFMFSQASHWDAGAARGPLLAVGVLFLSIGFWLLIGVTQLCVTVDEDSVRVHGARGLRELPLDEIDGYRYGASAEDRKTALLGARILTWIANALAVVICI